MKRPLVKSILVVRSLFLLPLLLWLCACHTLPFRPQSDSTTNKIGLSLVKDGSLPDARLTPGTVFPVGVEQICQPGYSSSARHVTLATKKAVFQRYGVSYVKGQYEVDHLISLELGGSNAVTNLWPEAYTGQWNAHIKDQLENRLHRLVCRRELPLATAQQAIARDWIKAYQQYCATPQDCPVWKERVD
ncbi:MAG: hypothetical protein ACAF41_00940 (plasmid) [Leptolyngbya sp. BL-A-14]